MQRRLAIMTAGAVLTLSVGAFVLRPVSLRSVSADDDMASRGAARVIPVQAGELGQRKFTVIASITEQRVVDVAPNGPSLGDLLVFSGVLRNTDGQRIGRIDGTCTTTSTPANRAGAEPRSQERRNCYITASFNKGRPPAA